jgi:hypothetical protein
VDPILAIRSNGETRYVEGGQKVYPLTISSRGETGGRKPARKEGDVFSLLKRWDLGASALHRTDQATLPSLSQMAFGERGCVSRFLRSHVDPPRTTTDVSNEASGWLNYARCADSHEDRAFVQSAEDAIQLERHFAEPADVRANPSPAVAPGKLGWRIVGVGVAERRSGATIAAAFEEFAVHVDDIPRPCLLVQVIHVLRAEEQAIL